MIKNRITFKQLEALICVVDVGTFRKAASVLGPTQPNISARISALEASLDVVLMHRDAGSVRLTEKGEELLAAARQVMWAAEAFMECAERRDLIEERLRLGVSEIVACTWLHEFLRRFRDDYPGIAVELDVNRSDEIERAHVAGKLDLGLQTGPFAHEMSGSILIDHAPYCWVAAPELADQLPEAPELQDLLSLTILTHARETAAPRALGAEVRARGLAEDRIVHSSSLASCLPMAVDGLGVALIHRPLARSELAAGRLREVQCKWLPPALEVFARYDGSRVPRYVQHAAQLAREVAGAEKGR